MNGGQERTLFIEAGSREAAHKRVRAVLAAIEPGYSCCDVDDRFYNLVSAQELIDTGVSRDPHLRLFESGWSGNKVICWVRDPMALVRKPGPLLRLWASLPAAAVENYSANSPPT